MKRFLGTVTRNGPQFVTEDVFRSFNVRCVLSDIDGTLLPHRSRFSDDTFEAIRHVKTQGYPFYPCTGRTRGSMISALGDRFMKLFGERVEDIPGVYQQGLLVYGKSGKLILEQNLENSIIGDIANFCKRHNVSVIAWAGEFVYCEKRSYYTDKITEIKDPLPIEVPEGLSTLKSRNISVQKMIIVDDDSVLAKVRPDLENEFGEVVSITNAVSGLLEVLPHGASKGSGVKVLLDHFNINPEHVIAFGDGENGSFSCYFNELLFHLG